LQCSHAGITIKKSEHLRQINKSVKEERQGGNSLPYGSTFSNNH
jgi:hypothetical protein